MMKRIKSKNIIIIVMTLAMLFTSLANAQQILNVPGSIKLIADLPNLTVGDQMPDFTIKKMINSPKRSMNTATFKDQLLIIDFWSIYCSGCVAALPEMAALQQSFGDRIRILPVTYEAEAEVSAFWKQNKHTKNLSLPAVVEDQVFVSYFRHQTIPHEVWVYKGKVIGITGPDYVDEHNIKKVLSGERTDWPVKNDFYIFDGTKQPLFQLDTNQVDTGSTPVTYAAISEYKEEVNSEGLTGGSGTVKDPVRKTIRTFFLNQPIYTAYALNWAKLVNNAKLVKPSLAPSPNQVIWEVADPSRYLYESGKAYQAEWLRANAICFESVKPDTGQTAVAVVQSVIFDLDHLLGLHVRWEKRKEKVLVLVYTTKSGNPMQDAKEDKAGTPLSTLTYRMNQEANNSYVFNETGDKTDPKIDIQVSSWTAVPEIRKALMPYGLDLKEEERLVDKFVFTEIKGSLLPAKSNNRLLKINKGPITIN